MKLHDFKYDPSTVLIRPKVLGGDKVKVCEHFYTARAEPMYKLSDGRGYRFSATAATVEQLFQKEITRAKIGAKDTEYDPDDDE